MLLTNDLRSAALADPLDVGHLDASSSAAGLGEKANPFPGGKGYLPLHIQFR